jgi:glycosyltransferase involved in cell wall biosynthesis
MSLKPAISIITIVRNRVNEIEKTIKSVVNQTYPRIEYIVVDGNSKDGTVEIIKKYAGSISKWVSEPDSGIYNAMNKGIDMASGEYIQFINSGDFFLENDIIERIFSVEQTADIIYGDYYLKEDKSEKRYYPKELTMYHFYISSLGHEAAFIKRELFDNGKYDENYRIVSDWKFFMEKIIFEHCSTKWLGFPVCFFDTTGISESDRELLYAERYAILREKLPERILADYPEIYNLRALKNTRLYRYFYKYFIKI